MKSICKNLNFENLYDNDMPINKYNIQLIGSTDALREKTEAFISESYQRNFEANLQCFFPYILTITKKGDDNLIAAVGIRYAKNESLFSECYLSHKIEHVIATSENCITARSKIIELGNFVVSDRSNIKIVIPILGQFIKNLNVDWAIYTLTRPIKKYFIKLGINLSYLNDADKSAVNGVAKNWGRYYNFKPAVYYSSVKNNLNS